MFIALKKSVGNNLVNRKSDVLQVKHALDRLGFFDVSKLPEPHGYITREMDMGIRKFQKAKGLKVDGLLFPDGETENSLKSEVKSLIVDNCKSLEVAYVNAESALFIAKQNLRAAVQKKKDFEDNFSKNNAVLLQINKIKLKEFKDKTVAKGQGAAFGGAVGAILGSGGGVGSSMAMAQVGMGVGANAGWILEDVGDALNSENDTDFTLDIKKDSILEKNKAIQETIKNQDAVIEKMSHEVEKRKQEMLRSKEAWRLCRKESVKKD